MDGIEEGQRVELLVDGDLPGAVPVRFAAYYRWTQFTWQWDEGLTGARLDEVWHTLRYGPYQENPGYDDEWRWLLEHAHYVDSDGRWSLYEDQGSLFMVLDEPKTSEVAS